MNMRKIIAILTSVLLLCAAIPMSALSVAADGGFDFENGTVSGWQSKCSIEVIDLDGSKVLKWDASGADWANVYYYGSSIVSANTDYTVSLRVKADRNTNMNFKVNNNWAGDTAKETFNVTTEWQNISFVINSGACTSGALLLFSTNTTAANGAIYYLDDISFVEYKEPGVITNGDFETGDLSGWEKHQSTAISTDAHSGSYAANIKGNGGWGGMLNQNVAVEAGKTYKISLWVKAIANGANIQVKDGGTDGANLESTWFTKNEWTNVVWEVTPTTDIICFNFCGGGNGIAEDVLVDDITIAEVKVASFDGYLYNGDFETGDETSWNLPQQGGVSADAAHDGSYGINIKGSGSWGGMLDQTFHVNAGKAYEISFWVKVLATGVNVQIKDGDTSGANIAGDWVDMNKAGDWTQFTYVVRPENDQLTINFCGSGAAAEDAYVDSVIVKELKDPSFDGYIYNGDFEVGDLQSWDPVWWAGNISIVEGGHNSDYAMLTNQGQWQMVRQKVTVKPNTNYVVSVYAKNASNMTLLIKDGNDSANMKQTGISAGDEWTKVSLEFNSGDWSEVYVAVMGNVAGATAIVDDFHMSERIDPSFDGYIYNGDFETGEVSPWNNLWGSCPTVEIVEGMDGYGLHIVSGQWKHVRQTNIAVKANTWYKITAWAKNTQGMSLLVKDGGDSTDIVNQGMEAGEEWTKFEIVFNTGDYTSIIFSLMGNNAESAFGTFDNIVMEVTEAPHVHEYDDDCDADCNSCGEWRQAPHELDEHYEAKVPANCSEIGWDEYWSCGNCGAIFGDAEASYQLNPAWIQYTGEHVRPEGSLPCTVVACEICGEDDYGEACTRPEDAPECQDVDCVYCGETIFGWGCNYNTGDEEIPVPLCGEGDCVYCGTHYEKLYDHENGSWASCIEDGECAYGCGLIFPATGIHELDDPCAGGTCWLCWQEIEGAHTYVYACDQYCNECGEKTNASAKHSIVYVAAKEAASCVEYGNIEYWYCEYCSYAWLDAACTRDTNLKRVIIAGECVSDSPACKDGVCVNCGLPCPAEADHVYDDEYDASCNECGDIREVPEKPVDDVIYGDANGDGEVSTLDVALLQQYIAGWDVTLDENSADANGDGEISTLDIALLQQFIAGWDVELGPDEPVEEGSDFNDGTLSEWPQK